MNRTCPEVAKESRVCKVLHPPRPLLLRHDEPRPQVEARADDYAGAREAERADVGRVAVDERARDRRALRVTRMSVTVTFLGRLGTTG